MNDTKTVQAELTRLSIWQGYPLPEIRAETPETVRLWRAHLLSMRQQYNALSAALAG